MAGGFPFPLELGLVLFEELALRGIVHEHELLRLVEPNDNDVMERRAGAGFERGDQRAALLQFALEVRRLARKGKGAIAVLLKVAHHGGGDRCRGAWRVQSARDLGGFGLGMHWLALLLFPVLHDHGDAGRAAAVFLLRHERHVEPEIGEPAANAAAHIRAPGSKPRRWRVCAAWSVLSGR